MKGVIACLYDPYIHVLAFGLLLVCCAIGYQPSDPIEAAYQPVVIRSFGDTDSPAYQAPDDDAGDDLRGD